MMVKQNTGQPPVKTESLQWISIIVIILLLEVATET